jgi:mono/diheme cytochrome c family protein
MKKFTLLLISVSGLALAAGDAAAGKIAYDKACKSCHGADGTANPAIAKMMKVEMKNLGANDVQAHSDDDMKKAIVDGVGKMKPTKGLAGKDADNMVAFVRTLKK